MTDFDENQGQFWRDEGIARVLAHNEDWKERCDSIVPIFLREHLGKVFTGEDIRFYCRDRVGEPKHCNGWGGLISGLVKSKRIVPVGKWVASKDVSSHATQIPLYRVNKLL